MAPAGEGQARRMAQRAHGGEGRDEADGDGAGKRGVGAADGAASPQGKKEERRRTTQWCRQERGRKEAAPAPPASPAITSCRACAARLSGRRVDRLSTPLPPAPSRRPPPLPLSRRHER
uniref:Uncharacterized protein n=1 Tax=Oryza sativa subsp. japonica TaxID=39947 RepID=Q6K924_ORYSJ|nr:hypothetical protein [Oryza sativa Japonica Group]